MRRSLSKSYLLANGFKEAGCWSASEHRLILSENLPYERGVYAFVVGDTAVYVGVAARSLRQRLGFYRRPDASQRTNVRLNALIRNLLADDTAVHIFIAQPPNAMWNGFRISGPEGLEAALIEDFDLPWNMRGVGTEKPVSNRARTYVEGGNSRGGAAHVEGGNSRGGAAQAIINFVKMHPGCTELEIAQGVFGPTAVQPRVNPYCRKMVEQGILQRIPTRPMTYFIKK